ncbi:MAG: hypothetical protein LBE06_10760 [Azoarcus sp.]|jgi:uncharacterized membrane protein|nr:hypothetical protein [Azoarcus sp.]
MPGWLTAGFAVAAGFLLPCMFWLCRWQDWPFWWCGIVLLPLALPRRAGGGMLAAGLPRAAKWLPGALAAVIGGAALVLRDGLPLQYYPVVVNILFLCVFAASLAQEQSLVERLARRAEPDLPPAGRRYARRVTQAWCAFFAANGALALWSIGAGETAWAFYNGFVAYLLMGAMFAGEWLVRGRVKRRIRNEAATPCGKTPHA